MTIEMIASQQSTSSKQTIVVCEEYGYKWWLWEFHGSFINLQEYWDKLVIPAIKAQGCLLAIRGLKGHLTPIRPINSPIDPDSWVLPSGDILKMAKTIHHCHIHESDDSWLDLKGNDNV
jgi:hypothetical protein